MIDNNTTMPQEQSFILAQAADILTEYGYTKLGRILGRISESELIISYNGSQRNIELFEGQVTDAAR